MVKMRTRSHFWQTTQRRHLGRSPIGAGVAKQAPRGAWWAIINSPVVLLLISSVIVAGGTKIFADRAEMAKKWEIQRESLIKLLAEYDQRVTALRIADERLNEFLGPKPDLSESHTLLKDSPEAKRWRKLTLDVIRQESEIMQGRGNYVPTDPRFSQINFRLICEQVLDLSGMPMPNPFDAYGPCLVAESRIPIWIRVRSQLDRFYVFSWNLRTRISDETYPLKPTPRPRSYYDDYSGSLGDYYDTNYAIVEVGRALTIPQLENGLYERNLIEPKEATSYMPPRTTP
jgi:hypothetical protein